MHKRIDTTMGKLSQFNQQQKQLEIETVTVEKSEPSLEVVTSQAIVMPQLGEYPVTIAWADGAKSYNSEIDLLEACLQHAPDLAWYCHFLNLAKPYILERSRKRRGIK